jgi:hypothetical protein
MMGNTHMRHLRLSEKQWTLAEQRVASAPIYEGSHRKKQANEVGFLVEVLAEEWFVSNGILFDDHRETTQEDYFIDEKYTLDVKTKDRTVKPALSYDNSVPLYNHEHQRPDYYLFISLLRDKKVRN